MKRESKKESYSLVWDIGQQKRLLRMPPRDRFVCNHYTYSFMLLQLASVGCKVNIENKSTHNCRIFPIHFSLLLSCRVIVIDVQKNYISSESY